MFCKQCGNRLEEGARFCNSCGATVVQENNAYQMNNQPMGQNTATATNGNAKLYKILAYFGILFLVGLLANKENDKSVRFHVGQGMLVCIMDVIVSIITGAIVPAIFKKEIMILGYPTGSYEISGIGLAINFVLWACVFAFAVIGIVNAVKDEDKKLPLIGDLAFYK